MKKAIHLRTFAFVLSENLPLKGAGERRSSGKNERVIIFEPFKSQISNLKNLLPLTRSPALLLPL
jgi:hypothetical protein